MRVIFFGSSEFAVPSLRAIARDHDVVAVYTQPDRPAGRGMKLTPTPVRADGAAQKLAVFTPERLDADFCDAAAALKPEALVTASYGKILPRALLELPALGALNIHPSLLPEYRGATPIQAALRDGRHTTGVSVIWMNDKMDAGDIAIAETVPIAPEEDYGSLHDRLAVIGAQLVSRALIDLATGRLTRERQDDSQATYTRPLRKEDLRIPLGDARSAVNVIRSLSPKPGAWLELRGKRVKVLRARAEDGATQSDAGSIVSLSGDGPLIACTRGALRLLQVVPEGKAATSGADFARSLA
ncbi:MAG: methionyl-tRNA formyltransferase [Candidatus Eremiobacteraeota bacterium]|nr:methionyl-tRNA formyltransferase [Candidatus Eremiobacteraeota bacterium]